MPNNQSSFTRQLKRLYDARVGKILHDVGIQRGRLKQFTKDFRDRQIEKLGQIATRILIRQGAHRALRRITKITSHNFIRPREPEEQILAWARKFRSKPVMYTFWRDGRCVYVGRTEHFSGRLRGHLDNRHTRPGPGTMIKVHVLAGKSQLHKAECLAITLFDPVKNSVKAASRRYSRHCKICNVQKNIRKELRSIFAL